MHIYFAQFLPQEGKPGAYTVFFPDLDGCATSGDNLAEALANAKECLTSYLETCINLGEEFGSPSPLKEAQKKAEINCRELGLSVPEEAFYQAVEADPLDEKPVQLSVSMVPSVIRIVDNAAKSAGMTRSGFLALAAKKYAVDMAANS